MVATADGYPLSVNEFTQSQAEDHIFFYYLAPRVTIIDSTTAGANAFFNTTDDKRYTSVSIGFFYKDYSLSREDMAGYRSIARSTLSFNPIRTNSSGVISNSTSILVPDGLFDVNTSG